MPPLFLGFWWVLLKKYKDLPRHLRDLPLFHPHTMPPPIPTLVSVLYMNRTPSKVGGLGSEFSVLAANKEDGRLRACIPTSKNEIST